MKLSERVFRWIIYLTTLFSLYKLVDRTLIRGYFDGVTVIGSIITGMLICLCCAGFRERYYSQISKYEVYKMKLFDGQEQKYVDLWYIHPVWLMDEYIVGFKYRTFLKETPSLEEMEELILNDIDYNKSTGHFIRYSYSHLTEFSAKTFLLETIREEMRKSGKIDKPITGIVLTETFEVKDLEQSILNSGK